MTICLQLCRQLCLGVDEYGWDGVNDEKVVAYEDAKNLTYLICHIRKISSQDSIVAKYHEATKAPFVADACSQKHSSTKFGRKHASFDVVSIALERCRQHFHKILRIVF